MVTYGLLVAMQYSSQSSDAAKNDELPQEQYISYFLVPEKVSTICSFHQSNGINLIGREGKIKVQYRLRVFNDNIQFGDNRI